VQKKGAMTCRGEASPGNGDPVGVQEMQQGSPGSLSIATPERSPTLVALIEIVGELCCCIGFTISKEIV